ncbi:hypothetical protein VB738_09785 [Cyanobium gracile UHCC 0139]|uniref:Uncharacterized protein n=1 Tax=Cyanobium gracile UHCC 0139 TaxID=3110308 RepID=A0ABU5RUS0_9CYAN|nr:hypothetical protein [Cyanobium gracile]MEA5391545.1 hypothetical protein [Cyanobium gracile UHCC 0139]
MGMLPRLQRVRPTAPVEQVIDNGRIALLVDVFDHRPGRAAGGGRPGGRWWNGSL